MSSGRMNTVLHRFIPLGFLVATLLSLGALQASPEATAITEASRSYIKANSAVIAPQFKVEAVKDNFARVRVVPTNAETDAAILFLQKKDGVWKGILIGTAFEPDDYESFHIPKSLRLP